MGMHDANELMFKYVENYQHNMSKSSIERYTKWTMKDIRNTLNYFADFKRMNNVIRKIVHDLVPNIIIGDFTFTLPLFKKCEGKIPCVPILSCNPLEVYSPNGPPVASGYSVHDSHELWDVFRRVEQKALFWLRLYLLPWYWINGVHPPPIRKFRSYAKHFGIYIYPECLDYLEIDKSHQNWVRMEIAVRQNDGRTFEIPECLQNKKGKLIYLSMGTLGSANLNLMIRLVDSLSRCPHRFVVSKGGHGRHYSLPDNMWGEDFVDQLAVLSVVDLVITNGGSNTILETLLAGKPLVVMPLFYDQFDNAQRIADKGLGKRIDPFRYEDSELNSAVEEILNNTEYHKRVQIISEQLKTADSKCDKVLELIEKLACTGVSPL